MVRTEKPQILGHRRFQMIKHGLKAGFRTPGTDSLIDAVMFFKGFQQKFLLQQRAFGKTGDPGIIGVDDIDK